MKMAETQKVFIFGGAGLIGSEISKLFAKSNFRVTILDIDDSKISEQLETDENINFQYFDVSNIDQCEDSYKAILQKYGCPDVFINSSYPRTKDWGLASFKDITLKSFRENIDIHLNTYAWLAKLTADEMVSSKIKGSIVLLGSIYGVVGQDISIYENTPLTENMTYATIKGGITNLTRQMASYYGQFGIRVNTLCPGGLAGHVAGKSDGQDPIFVENYCKKVPLRRLGTADEVASVALFLGTQASSYVSGATIMVDGGWTAI
jgi:NAD(P)-dependent dehydrogenase (short-subunit alcohol dehydrogenase family)